MMRKVLAIFLVLLLVGLPATAQTRDSAHVEVTALAVSQTSSGLEGVSATVKATVLTGGSGQVFVSTKPLAETDMQGSARLAFQVAANTLGIDATEIDVLLEMRSSSQVIGGPSAGAIMTLGVLAAMHNVLDPATAWELDPLVAATGTINPDGTIGPVGGVPEKAEAAAAAGMQLFLYPAGLETAATLEQGRFGLVAVPVEMSKHCQEIGIRCEPVATIEELLAHAAGITLVRQEPPEVSTDIYGPQLAQTVGETVDRLHARTSATRPEAPRDQDTIIELWGQAEDRLSEASQALSRGAYYEAATLAFQGQIFASRAEALTDFAVSGRDEQVVTDYLESCQLASTGAVERIANQTPRGLNHLYAIGAAQERAVAAQALAAEAASNYENARFFNDWVNSIFASAFCIERSETVQWWAELATVFEAGPAVGDLQLVLEDVVSRANELTLYAETVAGDARGSRQLLADAQELDELGYVAGAIVVAAQAQSVASVAVQAAASQTISPAVIEAANHAAARAIATNRAAGAEPMLPISLVELANTQTDAAQTLENLWTARTLALLPPITATPPEAVEHKQTLRATIPDTGVSAFLAIGFILGAAVVLVAWALWPRRY